MKTSVTLALAAATFAAAVDARAAGPSAEALFNEGRTLVLAKRYDEGCARLEASRRLEPGIGTLLWLGDCLEKRGDGDLAWRRFHEAAVMATGNKDDRARVAQRRATALEGRVARYIIVVAHDGGNGAVQLQRDGVVIPASEIGVELPITSGFHTIGASEAGKLPWSATVEITPRSAAVVVNVPVLARAASEATRDVESPALVTTTAPRSQSSLSSKRIAAISLAAGGIAAAGVGAYFGLHAKSTYDGSNQNGHCSDANACDATGRALRSDASGQALVSTVAFAGGATALGAAALFWFLGPPERRTVAVTPAFGPRLLGLSLTRAW